MGAAGAALGTTLSQAVSVVISLFMIRKKKMGIALKKQNLRPKRRVMGQILNIGVPVALQDGFIQVAFLVITIIANRRGLNQAAAVGIVEKIISFCFLCHPRCFLPCQHWRHRISVPESTTVPERRFTTLC